MVNSRKNGYAFYHYFKRKTDKKALKNWKKNYFYK